MSGQAQAAMRDISSSINDCTKHLHRCWNKAQSNLPQHAPLYAALFCSVVAITLSIHAHVSNRFVTLEEPLRVSPFIKKLDHVGVSTWELCVINQDALDEIAVDGEGDDGNAKIYGSTIITTRDVQRDVTSHVKTVYHNTPNPISKSWMQEPDHDDILVSADFPYNDDDDAFEPSLPADYWDCHYLQLNSQSVRDDKLWNVARLFFMMGSIMGVISTILLIALIVFRGRDAKRRQSYRRELKDELHRENSAQTQQQNNVGATSLQPNSTVLQNYQSLSVSNNLLPLDTDSSGYRPISICFLLSYLFQSLTLLFLDCKLCRDQLCSISTGARSLLVACALWVVSGLLVLFMMKKVRRNQRQVRKLKRRVSRLAERDKLALQIDQDYIKEDAESLLSIIPKNADAACKEEDCILDTTTATECSEFSSLASPEET